MKFVMFSIVVLMLVVMFGPFVWAGERVFVFSMTNGTTKIGWSEDEAYIYALDNKAKIHRVERCRLETVEVRERHQFVKRQRK